VLGDPDVGERVERLAPLLALAAGGASRDARRRARSPARSSREQLEVLEGAGDPEADHAARRDAPERAAVEYDVARSRR
jgi:hypothetical protein